MKKVFTKPESYKDTMTHYCPGCGHGITHRLICEVIDELGIREKTIGVAPVGCAVIAYDYWDFDVTEAAHGRTPAVATGIKRVNPENIVFTYQGDGDLAAIGTSEIIHTANRGELITVVFVNNAVYGMTSGQMAPTSLLGQKTQTTPGGRVAKEHGFPLKISEILGSLSGSAYIERVSVHSPACVVKARRAIKKAFQTQIDKKGFSLVEVLSPCPIFWGLPPTKAVKWLEENMIPYYPLGVIKDTKDA